MDIVVTLHLGFISLLVHFVIHHQFLLTLVLSLLNQLSTVLLQLFLSLLDKIRALLRGRNFCRLWVRSHGIGNLLVESGSFGLQDF